MNNEQFRNLLLNNSSKPQNGTGSTPRAAATPVSSLGSRQRSSIPMTPRTVRGGGGIDFQRQLAEQRAGSQPAKKFRSSAAPKGTKLAAGYTDRTQQRIDDEADNRGQRIKALEESMKLGQIDEATFVKLRDEITGGDIGATHLVKGLDRRLLERARRGENVWTSESASRTDAPVQKEPSPDVDEEFEKLEEKEIAPVMREKKDKKGEVAAPAAVAGTKRSRDAILAELKAQRKAAAEAKAAAQPQLGSRFKKIGTHQEEFPRIERDEKGREVLITKDEDGNIKRKVRKVKVDEGGTLSNLPMPDKSAKPLGADVIVPELPPAPVEEEDDDIFEGVGDSYDPLAGIGSDDSEDEDEGSKTKAPAAPKSPQSKPVSPAPKTGSIEATMPPPSKPAAPSTVPKTNYFNEPTATKPSEPAAPANPLTDPTLLAAIRKARDINPENFASEDGEKKKDEDEEARLKKRAAMLAANDRDFEDMDMGFGSSRFGDAEEMEEGDSRIKLSEWKGAGADDDDGDQGKRERGGQKRKRGPKKRKGDKNSAADVLRVMEQRKGGN